MILFFVSSPISLHKAKGDLYTVFGNYSFALESYEEALKVNDRQAELYYAKGKALQGLRQYDDAATAFVGVYLFAEDTLIEDVLELIPLTFWQAGKEEDALDWCVKLIKDYKNDSEAVSAIKAIQKQIEDAAFQGASYPD